jgi:DNA helicase IV
VRAGNQEYGVSSSVEAARELQREQEHVDRAYARLDVLKERARQRHADANLIGSFGNTAQAKLARDIFADVSARRMADLEFGQLPLVFGRTDHLDGESFHIGRVSVLDDESEPLVVDWRAPVAEPFYRATPADPHGLVRRRHLRASGQRVLGLEDELLDADSVDDRDLVLVGEGALLAALGESRTGRMRDIVATIQAEQDRIIRAPLAGTLVVQGGPGTGKTAVALHRAAFLLFSHRRSLEGGGVLLLGPSPLFLRYIERVLPSLGERAVRLRSLDSLVPGYRVTEVDSDAAARVKGDPRMVAVLRRTIQLTGRDRSTLTAGAVLRWLLQSAGRLAQIGVLNPREQALLRRPSTAGWTAADLPLLDELTHQLGKHRAARRRPVQTDQDIEAYADRVAPAGDDDLRQEIRRRLQSERARALGHDVEAERDEFAHVLVDEAQELSPMQWRSVARRCPASSFTIVGDLAQGSGPWAPRTWDEAVARMPGRRSFTVAELTVNYRTPARPAALAARVLRQTGLGVEPPRAVRDTGEDPVIVPVDRERLPREVARLVAAERQVIGDGRLLVVCPSEIVEEVRALFDDDTTTATRAFDALDRPVAVLTPGEVHGLEFDAVVVVEPAMIAGQTPRGLRALYVALTRTTRRLAIVHSAPLPVALR